MRKFNKHHPNDPFVPSPFQINLNIQTISAQPMISGKLTIPDAFSDQKIQGVESLQPKASLVRE